MIITDVATRRDGVRAKEAERDGPMSNPELGHPDRDVFDQVVNDLVRLELHASQALERLKLMRGTSVGHTRASRILVAQFLERLAELRDYAAAHAEHVSRQRKGVEQLFGHLGDREQLS